MKEEPMYNNNMFMHMMQPQRQTYGPTMVNGPQSALQVILPPNSMSDAIFDFDGKHFYIVSSDGTGSKTLETFHYEPDTPTSVGGAITRQEFDALVAKVNALGGSNGIHGSVQQPVPAATAVGNPAAAGATAANDAGVGQPAQ